MHVFISFSGPRAKQVALALREWLPCVLQFVKPWVSEADLRPGSRWSEAIGARLETTEVGILVLTRESLPAPWLLFEAGALAKVRTATVIPFLFGVTNRDVVGPLAQFNAVTADADGVASLIDAINDAA